MINSELSTEGFAPAELAQCPICKHYYWREVLKEHAIVVHGVEIKENWVVGK